MTDQEFRDKLVAHMAASEVWQREREEQLDRIEIQLANSPQGLSKTQLTGIVAVISVVVQAIGEGLKRATGVSG